MRRSISLGLGLTLLASAAPVAAAPVEPGPKQPGEPEPAKGSEPVASEPRPPAEPEVEAEPLPPPQPTPETGIIEGVVKDSRSGELIEGAIIVLQCVCLRHQLERMSSARGVYAFGELPAGNYTLQVLAGDANVSKIVHLEDGGRFRANFSVNPNTYVEPGVARTGGYVTIAVGGALIAAGLGSGVGLGVQDFEIPALGQHSDDLAMALGVGLGSFGAVMIAAGLGVLIESNQIRPRDRRIALSPSFSGEGGGLVLRGRF